MIMVLLVSVRVRMISVSSADIINIRKADSLERVKTIRLLNVSAG